MFHEFSFFMLIMKPAFTKKFIQIFKKWPKYFKLMFLFTLQKMHKQLNPFAIFLWVFWHVLMKWKNTIDQNNNSRSSPDDNPRCNERWDRTIRPESEVGGKDFWLSTKKKIFAWLTSLTNQEHDSFSVGLMFDDVINFFTNE